LLNNQHRRTGDTPETLKKKYANLKSRKGKYHQTKTYKFRKAPEKKKGQTKEAYDQIVTRHNDEEQHNEELFIKVCIFILILVRSNYFSVRNLSKRLKRMKFCWILLGLCKLLNSVKLPKKLLTSGKIFETTG
jgi:hypothetical protein